MGAISAANPVSKCLAPPTACPTLPEITEGVTGGLYAELFAGFAAAKAADATLTSPSQQPVAGSAVGEKMGTLEKRFETMTGSTDV